MNQLQRIFSIFTSLPLHTKHLPKILCQSGCHGYYRFSTSFLAQFDQGLSTKMVLKFWICIYMFLLSLLQGRGVTENKVKVLLRTNSGLVQGCVKDLGNYKRAKQFFGIPYAKPPVGELRWKAPEPVEAWTKTHDGCKLYPPRCLQQSLPLFPVEGILILLRISRSFLIQS